MANGEVRTAREDEILWYVHAGMSDAHLFNCGHKPAHMGPIRAGPTSNSCKLLSGLRFPAFFSSPGSQFTMHGKRELSFQIPFTGHFYGVRRCEHASDSISHLPEKSMPSKQKTKTKNSENIIEIHIWFLNKREKEINGWETRNKKKKNQRKNTQNKNVEHHLPNNSGIRTINGFLSIPMSWKTTRFTWCREHSFLIGTKVFG